MDNTTAADVEAFTQEVYEGYVNSLCIVAGLALLLYSTILKIAQEVDYIWSLRKFTLPSLLYNLARYGSLFFQGMLVGVENVPLGSTCTDFGIATNSFDVLSYIGVQGLLVVRAYSLCRGHKVMAALLALSFFSTLFVFLFETIKFPGCYAIRPNEEVLLGFLLDILIILNDVLVGGICLWNVWGVWKGNRKARLHGGHDLASVLIEQLFTRFIFVVVFSIAVTILNIAPQTKNLAVVSSLTSFQNVLSVILLCDFTLDLRQRNSVSMTASNISVSTLHFQNILQHIHQSIIVELGDNDNEISFTNTDEDGPEPESILLDRVGDSIPDQSSKIIISTTA